MEKYKILETIGDGTYGTVYKGVKNDTNEFVAIKKMKKKIFGLGRMQIFKRSNSFKDFKTFKYSNFK